MARRRLLICVLALLAASPVRAQFPPVGEPPLSADVQVDMIGGAERSHLDTVEAFLADQQWDEAIETLRRLMENEGDRQIAVDGATRHPAEAMVRYVPLRDFAQMRLARMHEEHPEALALYRRRVDPLAERWLRQGVAENDADLLARVTREMFVSSFGDQALMALGELALGQGDFAKARACWQRISPRFLTPAADDAPAGIAPGLAWWTALRRGKLTCPTGMEDVCLDEYLEELAPLLEIAQMPPEVLVYPDTDLTLADVWARLVLVSILEGSPRRAAFELKLLARWYPAASGRLGGREGKYGELLNALLEQSQQWGSVPTRDDWTTFAGNNQRNKAASEGVDAALQPIWRVPLARLAAPTELIGADRPRVAESGEALLSYHPVVKDGVVFVNEFTRIRAFHLEDGTPWPEAMTAGIFDTRVPPSTMQMTQGEYVGVPRSTLTVHGQRLYGRMGSPITGHIRPGEVLPNARSYLAGLELAAEGRLLPGFPIRLDTPEWQYWEFEGSPLVDASHVYIVMRHRDHVSAKLHVVSFHATTGEIRWRSPLVVAGDSLSHGMRNELTHTLLSRDGDRLLLNTNLGVVACLRASDGGIDWVTRYPRSSFRTRDPDDTDRHFFRDLNPCVLCKDLAIVAPADSNRVFALHATTGQLVWATDIERAADAVHLLGVGQGNVILSGDYLYWLDAESGRPVGQFPYPGTHEPGHGRPEPRGYGRGILAGAHVYFPTRNALYVFSQQTRHTDRGWEPIGVRTLELAPRGTTAGNLVIADGKLLIATADELLAFDEFGPAP